MKPTNELTLMSFDYEAHAVSFFSDGYMNLTEMCAAFDEKPVHFLRLDATRAFIVALAADTGLAESELLVTNRGGAQRGFKVSQTHFESGAAGTWAHPQIAMECARWLSPDFAIKCNRIVIGVVSGQVIHPAMDHNSIAKVECGNLAKLREVRESRLMLYGRLDVPGNVSFLAYRLAAGMPGTPVLGAHVGEFARRHALTAGKVVGMARQKNATGNKRSRVFTYPVEALHAAFVHLGYAHECPPLEKIEAVWRPYLPYHHRLNAAPLALV